MRVITYPLLTTFLLNACTPEEQETLFRHLVQVTPEYPRPEDDIHCQAFEYDTELEEYLPMVDENEDMSILDSKILYWTRNNIDIPEENFCDRDSTGLLETTLSSAFTLDGDTVECKMYGPDQSGYPCESAERVLMQYDSVLVAEWGIEN